MSKTTPALEELLFHHYAVLAFSRFGISQRQLNALMSKFMRYDRAVFFTNQLRRAGLVDIAPDSRVTCTESGAFAVEQQAAIDQEVNRLLLLAKLAAASDCSIYTILNNAEQILKSGLLSQAAV